MSLFSFVPYKKFPEYYDICSNTGILKFKKASYREYGDSYFMEEYQAQYKKTYYEDEANLRNLATRRIKVLRSLFGNNPKGKKLLEIGSAAGFFLDEARKIGFSVQGLELSEREVEYSKVTLGLDVEKKSVLDIPPESFKNSLDVIAAFFVLEHISDIESLWERLGSWTKSGGVVFLAVPSFFGPSFQTNPDEWFRTHPGDHFFDYDLRSLKKLLSSLGFAVKYARPMSYHPSRDLGLLGRLPVLGYKFYSDRFCYGDTIQVAAIKK
ncbi:2-polyprenyl-3-methyl-5-hydroxy-6-metoxy-1,4-benzoquinol methylase [Leptospira kobayashii]|uniref:2-polyprenyl-3-methyl-5-hydroxy-6-metoxy-1, 4-benzoquinol methylase n=1 Tax=Leptospira kobayashii TaxID=1917830 RepID=A0ABN6KED1_9LEPT|nr:class I SAM-dependent methyltransferase [Leptospira kobayashii]BDA79358.1 2-polyprenyl-3-methyl-5-hydroxy-6-metoxy-1,4-benzoquinol methylase [Leptospira kobayashii]